MVSLVNSIIALTITWGALVTGLWNSGKFGPSVTHFPKFKNAKKKLEMH